MLPQATAVMPTELSRCAVSAVVVVLPLLPVIATIRDDGVTVLLVEQDVQIALSCADRAYVIETGRVVHSGAAADLIDDPAVQQAYLGR